MTSFEGRFWLQSFFGVGAKIWAKSPFNIMEKWAAYDTQS